MQQVVAHEEDAMTETVSQTIAGSYRAEVRFAEPPAAVSHAFATLDGISGWWTRQVTGSAARGGELTLGFPNSDGPRVVLRVDTPEADESIVWSVVTVPPLPAWEEWEGTRIVVRLHAADGGGTTMQFVHEGLMPQLHCYDTCSRGWDGVLASLRSYVDTGRGNPYC
jgi:uncharacterized protein YndB with AHSA1/START domain